MAVTSQKGGVVKVTGQVVSTELKTCAAIINIFHLIPAASTKMIEPLLALTLKGEKDLLIEVGDTFSHLDNRLNKQTSYAYFRTSHTYFPNYFDNL